MRNDTQFYYFVDSYSNLWFIPPMIIKCDCMIFKFEYHNHKFIFSTLTCVALFFFRSPIHLLPYSEIYIQTFLGLPWRLLPVIQELPPHKKSEALRRNHDQMPKSPQLAPFDAGTLDSRFLPDVWAAHPIWNVSQAALQTKLILTACILPCPTIASSNSSLTWEPAPTTSLEKNRQSCS